MMLVALDFCAGVESPNKNNNNSVNIDPVGALKIEIELLGWLQLVCYIFVCSGDVGFDSISC